MKKFFEPLCEPELLNEVQEAFWSRPRDETRETEGTDTAAMAGARSKVVRSVSERAVGTSSRKLFAGVAP